MTQSPNTNPIHPAPELKQLAFFFLKLGTLAFGGPAAHVALMEDELVRRRRWLSREQFLDLWGAANLIPGPSSTELAIYIGYLLAGARGLLVAGLCFILPAFLMVGGIAWLYVKYGSLPAAMGLLYGVKPVVIAIVVQALWRLGRVAVKTRLLAAVGALAMVGSFLDVNPLLVLLGAGLMVALAESWMTRTGQATGEASLLVLPPWPAVSTVTATTAAASVAAVGLWPISLLFLKTGLVVFGSGYVLLAFLKADLVTSRHWLTEAQLLDAVAVGQVTPGPVFTTATFIGYLLAGPKGATVATLGIFLPAFLLVAITGPLVRRLRQSRSAGLFLDGVNVASAALIAVVAWQLGQAALIDVTTIVLGLASAVLLLGFRLNPTWLVAGGAVVGWLASRSSH